MIKVTPSRERHVHKPTAWGMKFFLLTICYPSKWNVLTLEQNRDVSQRIGVLQTHKSHSTPIQFIFRTESTTKLVKDFIHYKGTRTSCIKIKTLSIRVYAAHLLLNLRKIHKSTVNSFTKIHLEGDFNERHSLLRCNLRKEDCTILLQNLGERFVLEDLRSLEL